MSSSLEQSFQMNGNINAASSSSGAVGSSYPGTNCNLYGLSDFVQGWVYLDDQGEMCGPCSQNQLFEGLSTGVLSDELPVYPIKSGILQNSVPLKFFKLYPDHADTGFTYVGRFTPNVSTTTYCHVAPAQDTLTNTDSVLPTPDQQSHVYQMGCSSDVMATDSTLTPGTTVFQQHQQHSFGEERCWLFVDNYGRATGPHSLFEIDNWHQHGYLPSSILIRHINNHRDLFTPLSLINAWKKDNTTMTASGNVTVGTSELIAAITEEIGSQLHCEIINTAHQSVLDDVISNVIEDFVVMKKTQKQSKSEHDTEDLRSRRKKKRCSYVSSKGAASLDKNCTGFQKTANVKTKVRKLKEAAEELGFPPGFHPFVLESSLCNSSLIPHSYVKEENSSNSSTQYHNEEREGTIIAKVDEEFQMFGNASMVDFLKPTVEKEVFKPLEDNGTTEIFAEYFGTLCVENDSGHAASKSKGSGTGDFHFDETQMFPQGSRSSNQTDVSPQKHSSSNYLGSGFRRLGAPAGIAIDDPSTDEPPPPGSVDFTIEPCTQDLHKCLFGRFKTSAGVLQCFQAAVSSCECGLSDFVGSGSKRFGMPISGVIDDQSTVKPLVAGSGREFKDVVSSTISKFQPLGLGEGISNQKKLMVLALCRKKLHDDVLREWLSSFHDDVHHLLTRHVCAQPMIDLMERSKSCHSLGSSEEEFTYSRRRKVLKKAGVDHTSPPRYFKLRQQSSKKFAKPKSSKIVSGSGTLTVENVKQKARGLCQNESGSSTVTSKVGAANRNLAKVCKSIRLLNSPPFHDGFGPAQKYGVEKEALGMEADSTDNQELESCSIRNIAKKDELAVQKLKQSATISNLKRKNLVDESPSLPPKARKHINAYAKQADVKKTGRTKLSKSRVLSSCPASSGCARTSIDGWQWRKWSLNAKSAERAHVRGCQITSMQRFTSLISGSQQSHAKGISARTNRVRMRNLLAASEGIELLKTSQLMSRKKCLCVQRSRIHGWGLIALEPIERDDFVIEYVGELIRARISDIREQQYEKTGMGTGSSYLFKLDDGYVVDATQRGGIAKFINHSCEPNCYTKIVSVEGQKRIFIYAKRPVSAGEEITYNYKFPLEEKKIPCNCGSKRCRGSMN